MESLQVKIDGMHCDGCASTIEALLARHAGVKSASVSYASGRGQVLYDPAVTDADRVRTTIEQAGFRARVESSSAER